MTKSILIFFLSVFVLNNPVMAHSTHTEVTKHAPLVSVNAYYSQTSPVAGADVIIFAPGEDQPYQTGQTDSRGYFAFVPSAAGDWIFEIDDEQGHKKRVSISVDEAFLKGGDHVEESPKDKSEESPDALTEEDKTGAPSGIPFVYKLLFGLALIFGITGIYYGMRARQSLKKT
ncbi:MAG: hypothetical protein R6U46_09745 [Marinilabilia sp.]